MKDHLENFLTKQDADYFDKFFVEDENEVELEADGENENDVQSGKNASPSQKKKVATSIIKKKTNNLKKLSDLISQASQDIYLELEMLIDDLETSKIEGSHSHADALLEMSDFTEKMIEASRSINEIKDKI